jgi:hypothetical protein
MIPRGRNPEARQAVFRTALTARNPRIADFIEASGPTAHKGRTYDCTVPA